MVLTITFNYLALTGCFLWALTWNRMAKRVNVFCLNFRFLWFVFFWSYINWIMYNLYEVAGYMVSLMACSFLLCVHHYFVLMLLFNASHALTASSYSLHVCNCLHLRQLWNLIYVFVVLHHDMVTLKELYFYLNSLVGLHWCFFLLERPPKVENVYKLSELSKEYCLIKHGSGRKCRQ